MRTPKLFQRDVDGVRHGIVQIDAQAPLPLESGLVAMLKMYWLQLAVEAEQVAGIPAGRRDGFLLGPGTPFVTLATVRCATASLIPGASWNFTGTTLFRLKDEVPSFLMGGKKPDHLKRTSATKLAVASLPAASRAEQLTVVSAEREEAARSAARR